MCCRELENSWRNEMGKVEISIIMMASVMGVYCARKMVEVK
jgi:hypothetical protein